ncbi:signal peptidase II [Actinomadura rifamycini]|uniref:signal peptidase II n=1 Tax=Actinomadura rifamycini TaxID=31962 RepID=UPI000683DA17|nr:signal peptidase II [Actinomadura rifamycini]
MLAVVAVLALAADIVTKIVVVATLQNEEPIRLLGGLLTLRETRNSGAAFSIGTGYTIVFTLIASGVVVAIIWTGRNLRSLPWAVCLGLMLGGALGNLVDRVFRAPAPLEGHVVDWIQVPNWPVFNLADSAVVCGGVLAVILAARGLQLDGTRITGDKDGEDGEGGAAAAAEPAKPKPSDAKPSDAEPTDAEPAEERDARTPGDES